MNKIFFSGLFAFVASSAALAQVTVNDAWVRATVAEQKATGAFLTINSKSATRLVAISSPIAKAELHEMSMQGDRMMMREVPGLDIPAGKSVELKPGSYHVMLMGLKKPVSDGEQVPLTLVFEDKNKRRESVEVKAAVRPLNSTSPVQQGHQHHH